MIKIKLEEKDISLKQKDEQIQSIQYQIHELQLMVGNSQPASQNQNAEIKVDQMNREEAIQKYKQILSKRHK